jgi:hypothetical protein
MLGKEMLNGQKQVVKARQGRVEPRCSRSQKHEDSLFSLQVVTTIQHNVTNCKSFPKKFRMPLSESPIRGMILQ